MAVDTLLLLTAGVFVIALLYSSVGHAGASGYIAVMSLLSLAPAEIKPIALALNILVASIGSLQFWRAGHFSWGLFWPFALLSVPFAFLGGYLNLPTQVFKVIVGIVLLVSAAQFLLRPPAEREPHAPATPLAMGVGAGLGLLSGLTGTGGGIFLTPLLLGVGWAGTRFAAGTSAIFILANSMSGLAGNLASVGNVPSAIPLWLAAVAIGGFIGSELGSRTLPAPWLRRGLAMVLLVAGLKLILLP
jgi:uncharacterized membrane protein YfcA